MSYDPAWDMPEQNWLPQGSFESPIVPPAFAPDQGTLVCIPPVSQSWLPIIQGCLDQLRIPATWKVANDDGMNGVLTWVDQLKRMVSMAGPCCSTAMRLGAGCVLQYSTDGGATWIDVQDWAANFPGCVSNVIVPPVPPNPGPLPPNQHACNIAGFLATNIIQHVTQTAIQFAQQQSAEVAFVQNLVKGELSFLPITSLVVNALTGYFQIYIQGVIAHYQFAATDNVLWSGITCAIYNAIKNTGYVTGGNLGQVIANICAFNYTYTDVIQAICAFVTNIGLTNIQAIQAVGAVDEVDCSGCGEYCTEYNIQTTPGNWTPYLCNTFYTAGLGFVGPYCPSRGRMSLGITLHLPSTFTINQVAVGVITPNGNIHGGLLLQMWANGAFVNEWSWDAAASPNVQKLTASSGPVTGDQLYFSCETQGNTGNNNVVQYIQIGGVGPNPYGQDSCVH